jgi:hypothetical protein
MIRSRAVTARPDTPVTPEGIPTIDRHAAARAVEDNFVQTWQVVASAYGGELHDSDGLVWHSFQSPNEDPRSTSILRINLSDGQADASIDGMLATLRDRRLPAVWWTWRGTHPVDAGRWLLARGLEAWPAWPGMAMELDALPPPPQHDGFAVQVVRSSDEFRDVLAVLGSLGMIGIFAGAFERIGHAGGWGPEQPFEHFVGRLAAQRGGADRGHRFGVLQSSQMGFSVYRSIGLTLVCRLQAYELGTS